ncbi:MAG TPA: hypothetical protein VMP03_04220 [Methylomirabilota bacterium]|nr:hypothetical protein [Methylomirabilota bacterium]
MLRSIAALVAVTVTVVAGAAALALMHLAARNDAAAFFDRIYVQTERVFQAAIDPRFQTKADEVNRVLDRLVVIEAVAGGALFDNTGHLQQTFGETPETSFHTVRQAQTMIFPARDPRRVEFYFPPEATGTPFHLIARVDMGTASALEETGAARRTTIAAGTGGAAGLIAGLFCWWTVVRPLNRITAVVELMVANPGALGNDGALTRGRNEIGRLAGVIERFRGALADIWRTKVAVADAILERAPFGVIQMAADGTPTFANPAAAELFEREIVRGQGATPLNVRDVATGAHAALRDHLARHRGACRPIEIPGSRTPRFAVAGSLTIGEATRAPTIIAMFSDITDTQMGRLDAEAQFATGAAMLATARRRELELKLTLESCITLMSGPDRSDADRIDALPFAVEWLAAAKEAGMAMDTLVLNAEGPMVEGATEDLRAAMRLGLLVCYARCGSAPADIVIDAKGINFETAGVTIRAQPAAGAVEREPVVADWQLAFAALRIAIRRVNGQLTEFNATEEGAVLRFLLKGAAERMSTMKVQ